MDADCVHFLQWALPRLKMRWPGFRKVRRQVCRRIQKRMFQLNIADWNTYRQYLKNTPEEWKVLDGFCRITISRFYRDRFLFEYLEAVLFREIIHSFPDTSQLNWLSLGCASGEEPYTVAILWKDHFQATFPDKYLRITGLDIDPVLLQRAAKGLYPSSSLWELPSALQTQAFTTENELFALKNEYIRMVEFTQADIRTDELMGPCHIVSCRNLVATYFSNKLQIEIFKKIRGAMPEGAVLILGAHEKLTEEVAGFQQDPVVRQIYWAH